MIYIYIYICIYISYYSVIFLNNIFHLLFFQRRDTANLNLVRNVNRAILNWVPSHLLGNALMHVGQKALVIISFMEPDRKAEVVGGSIPVQRLALKDGKLIHTTSMK